MRLEVRPASRKDVKKDLEKLRLTIKHVTEIIGDAPSGWRGHETVGRRGLMEALEPGRLGMASDPRELARVSARLDGASPEEVLRWAIGTYGEKLTLSVSFGNVEGIVLLDMLSRVPNGGSGPRLHAGHRVPLRGDGLLP